MGLESHKVSYTAVDVCLLQICSIHAFLVAKPGYWMHSGCQHKNYRWCDSELTSLITSAWRTMLKFVRSAGTPGRSGDLHCAQSQHALVFTKFQFGLTESSYISHLVPWQYEFYNTQDSSCALHAWSEAFSASVDASQQLAGNHTLLTRSSDTSHGPRR